MGTVKAERRAEYEALIAEAVRRVGQVEAAFGHFSDAMPGTDGSLGERALRGVERMDPDALESAADYLRNLSVVADRARSAILAVRTGPVGYVIRTVDQSDGAFRFATNLRPGLAPTVTRDVRHAKRYVRKSSAERALAAFIEARGSDRDGFEIVQDGA